LRRNRNWQFQIYSFLVHVMCANHVLMTRYRKFLLASVLLVMTAQVPAYACNAKARNIASQMGNAVLLSVRSQQKANGATECIIKLKVPSRNGKPERIVTRTVQK